MSSMKRPEGSGAVINRYSKTLGKSRGRKKRISASLNIKPRISLKQGLTGVKAQTTIRF